MKRYVKWLSEYWFLISYLVIFFQPEWINAAEITKTRPNILYIMADDHAAHAISAYGSKINQTPNIDRLAKEGMRFDLCLVTNSICTPSRAAIITGKYAHKNGVPVFNSIDPKEPTTPQYLQKSGYYTGMIGKWHLGTDPVGCDFWEVLPGQGSYYDPLFITQKGLVKEKGYTTDIITDKAISFLKNRPKDKPFFLMCHHKAPHRTWQPKEVYRKKWEKIKVPEPETFNDDYSTRCEAAKEATMRIDRDLQPFDYKIKPPEGLTGQALKQWKYQRYMQDYLACIDSVDESIGNILKELDNEGIANNTIVVYTSDQGFFLGDHNWFDKRFMYEETLKMPFLVRWPAVIKPGSVNKQMVLNVDFAPTFLECAGVSIPNDIQGKSFMSMFKGEIPPNWRKSMYYRYYHYPFHHQVQPHYGVRTLRYKLIYFNKLNAWELYDLETDPHELKNVYADEKYKEIVKDLKVELTKLRKEVDDNDRFADKIPRDDVDAVLKRFKKKK